MWRSTPTHQSPSVPHGFWFSQHWYFSGWPIVRIPTQISHQQVLDVVSYSAVCRLVKTAVFCCRTVLDVTWGMGWGGVGWDVNVHLHLLHEVDSTWGMGWGGMLTFTCTCIYIYIFTHTYIYFYTYGVGSPVVWLLIPSRPGLLTSLRSWHRAGCRCDAQCWCGHSMLGCNICGHVNVAGWMHRGW